MARNLSTWILLRAMFSKLIGRVGPALRVYRGVFCLLARSTTPKLTAHLFPFLLLLILGLLRSSLKEYEYRERKKERERETDDPLQIIELDVSRFILRRRLVPVQ